jgi:4-carboxymuconolactone decarboxylase
MRLSTPRVTPLEEHEWDDETRKRLAPDGDPKNAFNVMKTVARHPGLLKRWLVFANHVLFKSTLPTREKEILILRIGWLCQAEYEFGQHSVIGKRAGLTDEEIKRITVGPDAPGWSDVDKLLMQATDELHGDAFITDPTWNALCEHFNTNQMMDIVFSVGQYNMVSMALNTLGVQLDEGVSGFPT